MNHKALCVAVISTLVSIRSVHAMESESIANKMGSQSVINQQEKPQPFMKKQVALQPRINTENRLALEKQPQKRGTPSSFAQLNAEMEQEKEQRRLSQEARDKQYEQELARRTEKRETYNLGRPNRSPSPEKSELEQGRIGD